MLGNDGWIKHSACRHCKWCGASPNKRLPPGEQWTGRLLDEAQGSELTPNALEDDRDRVGIRAPVLQTTLRQFRCFHWCPNFGKCDERHCDKLTLNSLATQTIALDARNARAGRKQAVDHSEQCRSRMEAILMTTTEGHERLERARDPFCSGRQGTGWRRLSASSTDTVMGLVDVADCRNKCRKLVEIRNHCC